MEGEPWGSRGDSFSLLLCLVLLFVVMTLAYFQYTTKIIRRVRLQWWCQFWSLVVRGRIKVSTNCVSFARLIGKKLSKIVAKIWILPFEKLPVIFEYFQQTVFRIFPVYCQLPAVIVFVDGFCNVGCILSLWNSRSHPTKKWISLLTSNWISREKFFPGVGGFDRWGAGCSDVWRFCNHPEEC